MKIKTNRLFFIDAMRAWAILMMLQGHFIDGLLDPLFRDTQNLGYSIWLYFRGITAPVFFTVSGFIFTFLLLRSVQKGQSQERVQKGIRRGLQLILIGYALRLNLFGLLKGEIYNGFFLVDVLHCIGLSILAIIGLFQLTKTKRKAFFPLVLVATTLVLFLFEPIYKQWSFGFLPTGIANYFTKANGSVFTVIPWLGYATLGSALSVLFIRFKDFKYLYPTAIFGALTIGFTLIYLSSPLFLSIFDTTQIALFQQLYSNNYLFIRLGDVFVVLAVFMVLRKFLINSTLLQIGSNTLSIYVIHFIILYGSFTGLGLYKFLHHELSPLVAIVGAVLFMFACTFLALQYDKHEDLIKDKRTVLFQYSKNQILIALRSTLPIVKELLSKGKLLLIRFFALTKN